MLHVAFLAVAGGCFIAAWWQVHRAMAGNTLSYLYSVEWPAFAVVAGIGWWQMFHDTPETIAARKAHHARMRAASAEVAARTLPRSARAITVGSEEIAGDRALGPGETPAAIESGGNGTGASETALVRARLAAYAEDGDGAQQQPEGSDANLLGPDPGDQGEEADEMTEYNRYLALLAVRGKAKTWRNPRGL
jgi:hypothetical protein